AIATRFRPARGVSWKWGYADYEIGIKSPPVRHEHIDGPRLARLVPVPPRHHIVRVAIEQFRERSFPGVQTGWHHAIDIFRRHRQRFWPSDFAGEFGGRKNFCMLGMGCLL